VGSEMCIRDRMRKRTEKMIFNQEAELKV